MNLTVVLDKNKNVVGSVNNAERRLLSKEFKHEHVAYDGRLALLIHDTASEIFKVLANLRGFTDAQN